MQAPMIGQAFHSMILASIEKKWLQWRNEIKVLKSAAGTV